MQGSEAEKAVWGLGGAYRGLELACSSLYLMAPQQLGEWCGDTQGKETWVAFWGNSGSCWLKTLAQTILPEANITFHPVQILLQNWQELPSTDLVSDLVNTTELRVPEEFYCLFVSWFKFSILLFTLFCLAFFFPFSTLVIFRYFHMNEHCLWAFCCVLKVFAFSFTLTYSLLRIPKVWVITFCPSVLSLLLLHFSIFPL